jgi:hypothetical protein
VDESIIGRDRRDTAHTYINNGASPVPTPASTPTPPTTGNIGGNSSYEEYKQSESGSSSGGQHKAEPRTLQSLQANMRPRANHHLAPLDPLNNPSIATPGALTPTPVTKAPSPWGERSNPGPLTSPLKDNNAPMRNSEQQEKQYGETLKSIFNLVCSLKEQQKEFSVGILSKMDVSLLASKLELLSFIIWTCISQ